MKINGSLVFDASALSQIENLRVEKLAALPTWSSGDVGRLVYVTGTGIVHLGLANNTLGTNGWTPLATGGDASALLAEVDAIESSLGTLVNANGTYNSGALTSTLFGGAGNLTAALNNLANGVSASDALSELTDVTLTTPTVGQVLQYNGTVWEDHTLVVGDIPSITATAGELNKLAGATVTTAQLNFVTGVTSSIQDQLDAKQASDATLSALAGLDAAAGVLVQTGADTFAKRSLVAPAAGFTITNPEGTAGDPTFVLANDLAGLEGLAANGFSVRTGDGTWTTRALSGTSGRITLTNADGTGGAPTFDLDTVTNAGGGTFLKLAVDGYGRVTGTSAVATADVTALVDASYVNVGGDTMTGTLAFTAGTITGLPTPTADTQAANKAYVDSVAAGLSWKQAVRVATTGPVTLATELEVDDAIDGVTLAAGDRVLVKNQAAAAENGIYVVQAVGAPVRASDMNAPAEFDGATVFVQEGTANQGSGWTETATITTIGTDAVVFSQFTGGAMFTWGSGLSNDGNTVNVNYGAGVTVGNGDYVSISLTNASSGGLILTTDGTARSTANNATLNLLLGGTSGLAQDATGLFIAPSGVTNARLSTGGVITIDGDGAGTGTITLGGTLAITGDATQGIDTDVGGTAPNGTISITARNASATQKGVASFAAADFTVTAGVVTINAIGNAQLDNSTITVAGTTGSDAVALGETLTVVGGAGGEVSTAVTGNQVAVSVRDATSAVKGVASFDGTDFTVTSGAVALSAASKTLDNLTDVTVTGATAGDILVNNGAGQFVNKKAYFLYDNGAGAEAAAATTHVVTHNLGQSYCNVTVIAGNEVVIPQSIVFNTSTQLTITFNTALACRAVVMGLAP